MLDLTSRLILWHDKLTTYNGHEKLTAVSSMVSSETIKEGYDKHVLLRDLKKFVCRRLDQSEKGYNLDSCITTNNLKLIKF